LRVPSSPEWFTSLSSSSTTPPPLTSSQLNKLENNLKGALSADEYANLLAHIEQYIDRVTVVKLQQHQKEEEKIQKSQQSHVNEEISMHITNLVKENFSFYKYELTDSDCDRIAESVKAQIKIYIDNTYQRTSNQEKTTPFVFSDENIKEIQKVVNQNFEINKHQLNVDASGSGGVVDFDGILFKVLKSPQLTAYVDEQLLVYGKANDAKFGKLNDLIDELRFEIKGVGEQISKTEVNHATLAANLNVMQAKQENLSNEFVQLKAAQDKKLDLILNEMNLQLAKNSEQQFLRLDEQIRKIILEILGYDLGEEGVTGDLDIKNWIRNIFVAKEYLEARLQEINNQSDHKIEEEIQKSAAIIMQEISQKIKREVIVVVDAEKKVASATQTMNVNVKGGTIGEEDVRRIVRESLAIYDADKTGLVDYALESAGGQVLSTRCTENYQTKSAQISIFGIPLWYPTNTPRTAITPAVQPGQCWAFQGFPGFLGELYI
jgi:SUN domain-containing protein 1/2